MGGCGGYGGGTYRKGGDRFDPKDLDQTVQI